MKYKINTIKRILNHNIVFIYVIMTGVFALMTTTLQAQSTGIRTLDPTEALDVGEGNVRIRDIISNTGNSGEDLVVVVDSEGVLKTVNAARPHFFYMPSIVFDTSVQGTGFTRDLHANYEEQFGTPAVSSAGATGTIPILPAEELEYYITYYDDEVFDNLEVDANGVLTYDVIGTATPASFMNIVFVVK